MERLLFPAGFSRPRLVGSNSPCLTAAAGFMMLQVSKIN
jgi:hypothetical protein